MRKFTLFLSLFVAFATSAFAQITSVEDLSNSKCYTIVSKDTGRGGMYAGEGATMVDMCGVTYNQAQACHSIALDATSPAQQFAFVNYNDKLYLYSVGEKKFVGKNGNVNKLTAESPFDYVTVTLEAESGGNYFSLFLNDANYITASPGWCADASRGTCLQTTLTGKVASNGWDDGAWFTITEAGAFDATEALAMLSAEAEALAAARAAFDEAYAEAATILADAELNVTETEVALQTKDNKAAYYLWSNVPDPEEGSIDALVDGTTTNGEFFHSSWHSSLTADMHYLEVDLGEGNEIAEFTFGYHTRVFDGGNDFPDKIQVMGSNDGTNYTEVYNVTSGLPQGGNRSWKSGVVSSETAYRYFRFNVTAERTYWHMSEFDIITNEISVADKYAAVAKEIVALNKTYTDAANNANYDAAALTAVTESIKSIIETVNAGVTVEPEVPFEVVAVTPSEAVTELSTITVEFSEEIAGTQDLMAMETIYVGSRSNAANFTVEGKVLTITLWTPITTPGEYALKVPASVGITRASNGEAVTINGEITFTVVAPKTFAVTAGLYPVVEGDITEIKNIRVQHNEGASISDLPSAWTLTNEAGNVYEISLDWGLNNFDDIFVSVNPAITEAGTYTLTIPAGSLTTDDGKACEAAEFSWIIAKPVEPETPFDWAGTYVFTGEPTSKDGSEYPVEFEVVVEFVEANAEIGQEEMYCVTSFMGNDVNYINYGGIKLTIAEDGKSATLDNGNVHSLGGGSFLKIFDANGAANPIAITLNEDGTLTMADFTVVMGTWGNNENNTIMAEYKNSTLVKGELPEPETPTLNETVIFDFVNGAWGIPTMEQNNFSNIKTAGEYTDGTKTINIDPTANGGSYIYNSKGFLQLGKPGSKITLPAFDFAVEKIEVVGHSSATSYPNVDMNVFVGGNAVSTACIGTTATSTFEIAADNQAAGNVYELVIGSNGDNYSSVMYITYIKVYPAENKLEAPAIDLESGVYVGAQTVNVHSATADLEGVTNVTYYYTTDGNEPTVEDEEAANGEITIENSCTLKVIVELTYGDKTYVSASTSAEYIISEAVTYHRAVAVESGSYFLAANGHVAAPLANGVLPGVETTIDGNDLTEAAYYAITLEETAEGGAYYIKDVNGNYIYTSSMYGTSGPKLSSNGAYIPMSSWTITVADDENSTATIVSEGLTLVYDTAAGVFKVTESVSDGMVLPTFYGVHATGVENIITNGEAIESIFDLNGRKIEKITESGIYIVNGKKVFVK